MSNVTTVPTPHQGLRPRKRRGDAPRRVKCQVCGAPTIPGLDLGHQPISDLILSRSQLLQPETHYPLQLYHCMECGLTQLGYIANPKVVFKAFPFVSGTTQTATRHLQSLPRQLAAMGVVGTGSFAVDIGSNDGTLLKGYLPFGVRFLGVDPAGDPVRIANAQGLETLHAFFNEETAGLIMQTRGQADAITACGVFAHIADLAGVMRGVKKLLAPRGVFATDSQYWLDMVQRGQYDNIFHQHLRYYSMRPLIHLFDRYEMDILDVERSGVYGGSIRVFSCHRGDLPISQRVTELLAYENEVGLYDEGTHRRFAEEVETRRRTLQERVYRLKSEGRKIIGIGAPAKATVVCNYSRLGPEVIDYVTEINPLRMGMYMPGTHIPIVDEQRMFTEERPADAGILFAWNYYDEIAPKLRERGWTGEILLP